MHWVFIAAHRLSPAAGSRGYSHALVSGLLIAVASPVAEHSACLVAQMVKNLPRNVGDLGLILGLGRSPGEDNGYSLQFFGLEKSMDCIVHGVAKSQT